MTNKPTKPELEELLAQAELNEELTSLTVRDLKKHMNSIVMAKAMIDSELKKLEVASLDNEKRESSFKIKRWLRAIEDASMLASTTSEILRLKEVDKAELQKKAIKFSPLERIEEVLQGYEHLIIKRELGMNFYYPKEIEGYQVKTNLAAFSSVVSNLFGNAMDHAYRPSVLKSMVYTNGNDFIFEIENMVNEPIDYEELANIFKKGYRKTKISEEQKCMNEGLGLYFAQKIIRKGFEGNIEVTSEDSFNITNERTNDFMRKDFGIIVPETYEPLPSFHAKVTIPLIRVE